MDFIHDRQELVDSLTLLLDRLKDSRKKIENDILWDKDSKIDFVKYLSEEITKRSQKAHNLEQKVLGAKPFWQSKKKALKKIKDHPVMKQLDITDLEQYANNDNIMFTVDNLGERDKAKLETISCVMPVYFFSFMGYGITHTQVVLTHSHEGYRHLERLPHLCGLLESVVSKLNGNEYRKAQSVILHNYEIHLIDEAKRFLSEYE